MHRRHPLPRLWLMTDERMGDALWTALDRLPRGSGVVFRHYSLPTRQRRELFRRLKRHTAGRRLVLVLGGSSQLARAWGADGFHGRHARRERSLIYSAPVHNRAELLAAERAGADVLFVSPVFATRSHPGGRTLGTLRFALLARLARVPVVALGGMNQGNARRLRTAQVHGWAAIDAWC